jgi:hypothetical protein
MCTRLCFLYRCSILKKDSRKIAGRSSLAQPRVVHPPRHQNQFGHGHDLSVHDDPCSFKAGHSRYPYVDDAPCKRRIHARSRPRRHQQTTSPITLPLFASFSFPQNLFLIVQVHDYNHAYIQGRAWPCQKGKQARPLRTSTRMVRSPLVTFSPTPLQRLSNARYKR